MSKELVCQKCGKEINSGLECEDCGIAIDILSEKNTVECPSCGKRNVKGFMFCTSCKNRLSEKEEIEIPEKFDFSVLSASPLEIEQEIETAEQNSIVENIEIEMVDNDNLSQEIEEKETEIIEEDSDEPTIDDEIKSESIDDQLLYEEPGEKYCKNCGNKIKDGQMFCTKCGTKY